MTLVIIAIITSTIFNTSVLHLIFNVLTFYGIFITAEYCVALHYLKIENQIDRDSSNSGSCQARVDRSEKTL